MEKVSLKLVILYIFMTYMAVLIFEGRFLPSGGSAGKGPAQPKNTNPADDKKDEKPAPSSSDEGKNGSAGKDNAKDKAGDKDKGGDKGKENDKDKGGDKGKENDKGKGGDKGKEGDKDKGSNKDKAGDKDKGDGEKHGPEDPFNKFPHNTVPTSKPSASQLIIAPTHVFERTAD